MFEQIAIKKYSDGWKEIKLLDCDILKDALNYFTSKTETEQIIKWMDMTNHYLDYKTPASYIIANGQQSFEKVNEVLLNDAGK